MRKIPVARRIETAASDSKWYSMRYIATADWLEAIVFGMAALDAYGVFNESHDTVEESHKLIRELTAEICKKLNTGQP